MSGQGIRCLWRPSLPSEVAHAKLPVGALGTPPCPSQLVHTHTHTPTCALLGMQEGEKTGVALKPDGNCRALIDCLFCKMNFRELAVGDLVFWRINLEAEIID